jgi:acyl-CoA synthetase (AMP-forming)/AMP-acid ligase II
MLNGSVYVPVDPLLGEERNLQLLEHCTRLKCLLIQKDLWKDNSVSLTRIAERIGCGLILLPRETNDVSEVIRAVNTLPDDYTTLKLGQEDASEKKRLAYVMFTSGTTRNTPTTVYVPHECVLSNIISTHTLSLPFSFLLSPLFSLSCFH